MREIKFRGWERDLKVMVYEHELCGHTEYACNSVRAVNIILNEDDMGYEYMQYTGYTDSRGQEIYEGDIVRYNKGECIVEFDFAKFILVKEGDDEFIDELHSALTYSNDGEFVVFGNIYEGVE